MSERYNLRKRQETNFDENIRDEKSYKKFKRISEKDELKKSENIESEDSYDESDDEESLSNEEDVNEKEAFMEYLKDKLKNLGLSEKSIENIIQKKFKNMFDESPEDKIQEEEKKLNEDEKRELNELRYIINEEKPSLQKILNARLPRRDKKRCIELFEILQNYDETSQEYDKVRYDIKFILDKELEISQEEIDKYDDKEVALIDRKDSNLPLKYKILDLEADIQTKRIIYNKYQEMESLSRDDKDYNALKNWIEWAISIPHNRQSKFSEMDFKTPEEINDYLHYVRSEFDKRFYGLDKVKEAFIEELANKITNKEARGYGTAIALLGQPGTAKSSIAKAFAEIIKYPYDQISLGGVNDPGLLHGSDSVNIGATPGIIVKILKRMKYNNGILLFDEIDKLGDTPQGKQVQYALLHITDFTQNQHFRDTFLNELQIDLSNLWFIYAMNDESSIDEALVDRLPIIKISPYTQTEKKNIITGYILTNLTKSIGFGDGDITISDEATYYIISLFGNSEGNVQKRRAGLRAISDKLKSIIRKLKLVHTISLSTSTTKLKLSYNIPNFKLPFKITREIIDKLTDPKERALEQSFMSMYV